MLYKIRLLLSAPYGYGIIQCQIIDGYYRDSQIFYNKESNCFEPFRWGRDSSIPHYSFKTRREAISRLKSKFKVREIEKSTELDRTIYIEVNE